MLYYIHQTYLSSLEAGLGLKLYKYIRQVMLQLSHRLVSSPGSSQSSPGTKSASDLDIYTHCNQRDKHIPNCSSLYSCPILSHLGFCCQSHSLISPGAGT